MSGLILVTGAGYVGGLELCPENIPRYHRLLALRLDGARDLYLLALALGERTRTRKERPRSAA